MQENNRIEIKRFDKERRRDFIEMLKGFVVNQVRVLHCSANKNTEYSHFPCTFADKRECDRYNYMV